MITLTFPDGAKREVKQGLNAAQVAASISKSLEKKAVAAVVNGVLVDLNDPIKADATLQIVTRDDDRALELIRHDCAHVLAEAVQELYPGTQSTSHNALYINQLGILSLPAMPPKRNDPGRGITPGRGRCSVVARHEAEIAPDVANGWLA